MYDFNYYSCFKFEVMLVLVTVEWSLRLLLAEAEAMGGNRRRDDDKRISGAGRLS